MGRARPGAVRSDAADTGQPPASRTLTRRRGLPSGRAVVGGFLMAAAAVGVFGAYTAATAPPTTSYLVATRAAGIGQELTADDLGLLAIELPPPVRDRMISDPERVLGTVAVAPISEGDLISTSMVRDRADARDEVSFSLPLTRVFGDGATRLRAGEHVDLIATYGTGRDATSCVVTRDSLVLNTETGGDALAGRGQVTVLVGFDDADEALAVTHAVTAGEVSLVRVNGRRQPPATECFHADLEPVSAAPTENAAGAGGD